jgi:hypothetical protein
MPIFNFSKRFVGRSQELSDIIWYGFMYCPPCVVGFLIGFILEEKSRVVNGGIGKSGFLRDT